MVPLVPVTVTV
jgi:hypothetical protein